jgi:hypothetical protein
VTAFITLAAIWAAFASVRPWEGGKSVAALLMFGAGAVIAGCVTRYSFSRKRTFGDFIAAVDGDETDTVPERRPRAPAAGSLETP